MPINMPDIPNALEIRRHAPEMGEHSDEVLAEYGYGEEEITGFRKAGVI
jgi:crotonobetainyl-CoA:carnitine CoA-transferase CaiB-like acyl-CoA transferase